MSLHYLLDGYNIIYRMPGEMTGKLEEQRLKLIRYLEARHLQGSERNQLTIVFDGKFGFFGQQDSYSVRVVFSQDETADDLIKEIVASSPAPKSIVVVTDDRPVQFAVKALGAQIKSVDDFMQFTVSKSSGKHAKVKKPAAGTGKKPISHTLEAKINAEFEQIWLKKKPKE